MTDSYYEHLFSVKDKVVLVTGGTRGIGYMIAEGFVRCGATVYIASRKPEACQEAEQALSKHGNCVAIPSDISDVTGCEKLADEIKNREAKLDVLINNAGVTWSEDIDRFSEKAWYKIVDLDGKSPFFLTQKLLPLLDAAASQASRAIVINVSAVNGIRPSGLRNYSYAFAKAGLQQLSVQMAQDLNERNINVNVIITNNANAGVINIAQEWNIPIQIIDNKSFKGGNEVVEILQKHSTDWVILAGFLRKIAPSTIAAYPNQIINIHPALLPNFGGPGMYGMRVHQAVVAAKAEKSGITIHYVTPHYDEGEIIFQATTAVSPEDTPERLAAKVHQLEYEHYPNVIANLLSS